MKMIKINNILNKIIWLFIIFIWLWINQSFANNLIYQNNSDHFLYIKSDSDSYTWIAITSIYSNTPTYSPDWNYIVYSANFDWQKLYKKSASDNSNGTPITSWAACYPTYSPDWNYIIASINCWWQLWKKSALDNSDLSQITSISANNVYWNTYSPDWNYIVYTSLFWLYKKSAFDSSNGTAITSYDPTGNTVNQWPTYSPDWNYIVYTNWVNWWNRLYKKSAFDSSDGTPITSAIWVQATYSPDWNYIVYVNTSDWNKLYKKSAFDTSDGIPITSWAASFPKYSPYIPPVNGSCGSSATIYNSSDTSFTGSLCSAWTASPSSPTFPAAGSSVSWSCLWTNWGTTASCTASRINSYTDWVCGSSATIYNSSDTSFTGTLCSAWTASPSSPTFPAAGSSVGWYCLSPDAWNNVFCSASRYPYITITNGSCGSSATIYNSSDTSFTGTLCSAWTASPSSPTFPAAGSSVSWSCLWTNWGTTASCTAKRYDYRYVNWQCWPAQIPYNSTDTGFFGSFCAVGTVSPSSPTFPAPWWTVSWSCLWANGGTTASCSSQRNDWTGGFSFPDFSWLVNWIADIGKAITNIFKFSFEWIWFNFDFSNQDKLFSVNFATKRYSILDGATNSCSPMLWIRSIYQFNQYNTPLTSESWTTGTYVAWLPECVFNTDWDPNSWLKSQSMCIYNYWSSVWTVTTTNTTIYKKGFNYVIESNPNANIITINDTAIKNMRIIPFSLVMFGWDAADFLNSLIVWFANLIVNLIILPVNAVNHLYKDVSILFNDFPSTYCFYGMKINKIALGTWNPTLVSSDIPYTTTEGAWTYLIIIFAISFLTYLYKKI